MPPEPQMHAGAISIEPEQNRAGLTEPTHFGPSASALGQSAELNAAMLQMPNSMPAPGAAAADPAAEFRDALARKQIAGKAASIGNILGQWSKGVSHQEKMAVSILKADLSTAEAAASQGVGLAQTTISTLVASLPGAFAGVAALVAPGGIALVAGQAFASALGAATATAMSGSPGVQGFQGEPALIEFVHRSIQPAEAGVLTLQALVNEDIGPRLSFAEDPHEALKVLDGIKASLAGLKAEFESNVLRAILDAHASAQAKKATLSPMGEMAQLGANALGQSIEGFSSDIAGPQRPEGAVEVNVKLGAPGSTPQVCGITTPGATPDFKAAFGNRPLSAVNAPVRVRGELDVGQPLSFDSVLQMAGDGSRPSFMAARTPADGSTGDLEADAAQMPIHMGASTPSAPLWLARHGAGDATLTQANPALVQRGVQTIYDELDGVILP